MSTLSLLIDVLGPVVLIVAVGAYAGPRLGIVAGSLSSLAYWILGPAFVFQLLQDNGLDSSTVLRLCIAGVVGMVAAVLAAVAGNRAIGSTSSVTAASVVTSAYGNVGNAGLAITVFALGDDALPAAGILMLVINVLGITLGVGLAAGQTVGVVGAVRRAVLAPMAIAAIIAMLTGAVDVAPPLVVERSIGLLAGALIPVMLFTLGLQLAITGLRARTPDLGVTIVAKLVVAPLAATTVARLVGLDGDLLWAVAIQSAMPPAVFCMVLAMEHDLETERVTSAVVMTTLASLVTLPVVLAFAAG
ncbi:MAG: AEC family transporter [Acidimicrobiales bacterium]